MNATGRTNNTHTHPEIYRLTRWIETNQLTLKGMTQEKIGEAAGEATGLKVTASNVRGVAETLGITLGLHAGGPRRMTHDSTRALARAIRDLYKRLGEEVPEDVNALAHR